MSHFVAASADISARVERLLNSSSEVAPRAPSRITLAWALATFPALVLAMAQPAAQRSAHELLERLMH
jgi:hypothetical protein